MLFILLDWRDLLKLPKIKNDEVEEARIHSMLSSFAPFFALSLDSSSFVNRELGTARKIEI